MRLFTYCTQLYSWQLQEKSHLYMRMKYHYMNSIFIIIYFASRCSLLQHEDAKHSRVASDISQEQ
jgi:hypothetical protein